MSGTDELAEINGLKPKVWLTEGDQRIVNSMSSSSVYKVKRTLDHFYCDCMAWRNQKAPINARSCKHLKELLGAEYEEARCEFKDPEGYAERAATRAKGAAKAKKAPAPKKAAGKKRKAAADDDDDDDEAPRKKAKASTSKAKTSKSKDLDEDDEDDVVPKKAKASASKAKASKKSKDYDDDEEAEEDDAPAPKKPAAKTQSASKPPAKKAKKSAYDDEDEESEEEAAKKPASSTAKKFIPSLLLANKYDLEKGPDPKGWWCSEKLDGVRAYYDKIFLSRQGNEFFAPDWFMEALPKDVQLDGELFGGRGQFNSTVSIVRTKSSPHWKSIKYYVFDIPSHGSKPFEDRMKLLEDMFGKNGTHQSDHIVIVDHTLLKDREQMDEMLEEVQKQGGEGLMLRKPGSTYQGTRSSTLLKVKTFHDAEARVIGYKDGRGKNLGLTGALICEMASKKTFQCGSGLTDAQRKHPPKIGSIIVYKFMEITASGVPRHPTFVGEAADKTEPKDADLAKPAAKADDCNEDEDMEE